jgi:PTS system nitrogen regulatory IIA component
MEFATQWVCPQHIELDVDVPDRREALRAVSVMIARAKGLAAPPVYRALWRREMAGSTGMGGGLAIPHARIAGITEPVTAYVRMRVPLNFAAPDGKRVSELYVILIPAESAQAEHLQLLARVAQAFGDRGFRTRLAAALTPREVRVVFSRWVDERQPSATPGRCAVPALPV